MSKSRMSKSGLRLSLPLGPVSSSMSQNHYVWISPRRTRVPVPGRKVSAEPPELGQGRQGMRCAPAVAAFTETSYRCRARVDRRSGRRAPHAGIDRVLLDQIERGSDRRPARGKGVGRRDVPPRCRIDRRAPCWAPCRSRRIGHHPRVRAVAAIAYKTSCPCCRDRESNLSHRGIAGPPKTALPDHSTLRVSSVGGHSRYSSLVRSQKHMRR